MLQLFKSKTYNRKLEQHLNLSTPHSSLSTLSGTLFSISCTFLSCGSSFINVRWDCSVNWWTSKSLDFSLTRKQIKSKSTCRPTLFLQGHMWRKWQPQMQMTLPMETVLEWYTASSMASHTSLLTLKQVKYFCDLWDKIMIQSVYVSIFLL